MTRPRPMVPLELQLAFDFHEGAIERMTLTVEAPSAANIRDLLGLLDQSGVTILGGHFHDALTDETRPLFADDKEDQG